MAFLLGNEFRTLEIPCLRCTARAAVSSDVVYIVKITEPSMCLFSCISCFCCFFFFLFPRIGLEVRSGCLDSDPIALVDKFFSVRYGYLHSP